MAAADDLQRLHQRHAGAEHGRHLTQEDRDVAAGDLALAFAEPRRLFAHEDRVDAVAPQLHADEVLAGADTIALDAIALATGAFPEALEFLDFCFLPHPNQN